jgi:hypothetical protein
MNMKYTDNRTFVVKLDCKPPDGLTLSPLFLFTRSRSSLGTEVNLLAGSRRRHAPIFIIDLSEIY